MGWSWEGSGGAAGGGHSLSVEAIVAAQDALVLLVGAELDGGVGHHAHHGGRVPAPQAEEALVEVGEIQEPEGLLGRGARSMPLPAPLRLHAEHHLLSTVTGAYIIDPTRPCLPHILWAPHRDPSLPTLLTL